MLIHCWLRARDSQFSPGTVHFLLSPPTTRYIDQFSQQTRDYAERLIIALRCRLNEYALGSVGIRGSVPSNLSIIEECHANCPRVEFDGAWQSAWFAWMRLMTGWAIRMRMSGT